MRLILIVGAVSITLIGVFLAVIAVIVSLVVLPFVLAYGWLRRMLVGASPASTTDARSASVEAGEGRENVRVRRL